MKLLLVFILLIGLNSCNSPSRDIVGKWRLVKSVTDGFENDVSQSNSTAEFFENGEIINYQDGKMDRLEAITYKIENDSIFATIITAVLDGTNTETRRLHFIVNEETLRLSGASNSFTEYTRIK